MHDAVVSSYACQVRFSLVSFDWYADLDVDFKRTVFRSEFRPSGAVCCRPLDNGAASGLEAFWQFFPDLYFLHARDVKTPVTFAFQAFRHE